MKEKLEVNKTIEIKTLVYFARLPNKEPIAVNSRKNIQGYAENFGYLSRESSPIFQWHLHVSTEILESRSSEVMNHLRVPVVSSILCFWNKEYDLH